LKSTTHRIRFHHKQIEQILAMAQSASPDECCGIISGTAGQAHEIIPIDNTAADKRLAFQMHPQQLLQAFKHMDDSRQSILAIYHSHPASSPIPSELDIQHTRQHYAEIPQIIISLQKPVPEIKAWRISRDHVQAYEAVIGTDIEFEVPLLDHTVTERILFAWILVIGACILLGASLLLLPPAPILGSS
jgi:proteasome lid subunit RPN8/RPN11